MAATLWNVVAIHTQAYECLDVAAGARQRLLSNSNPYARCPSISSLFMPLGIGVYEDKQGNVYLSRLNVGLMGMMFGGTISDVMGMAGRDI